MFQNIVIKIFQGKNTNLIFHEALVKLIHRYLEKCIDSKMAVIVVANLNLILPNLIQPNFFA